MSKQLKTLGLDLVLPLASMLHFLSLDTFNSPPASMQHLLCTLNTLLFWFFLFVFVFVFVFAFAVDSFSASCLGRWQILISITIEATTTQQSINNNLFSSYFI